MNAHTPGPWFYSFESVDPEWAIVITVGGTVIANVNADHRQQANTDLIVAAPEMYAALKRQQDNIRRWLATGVPATEEESKQISDQIDAAIAKAEGQS
jgi:hypothetical protein